MKDSGYYKVLIGDELYEQFWNNEHGALEKVKVLRENGVCY